MSKVEVKKISTSEESAVLAGIYAARGDNLKKPEEKKAGHPETQEKEKKKRGRKPKVKEPVKEEPEEEEEEGEESEEEIDVDELLEELKTQKDELEEMSLRLRLVEDFLSTEFEHRVKEYRDMKAKQFKLLAEAEEDKKEQELDKFLGTTPRIRPKK